MKVRLKAFFIHLMLSALVVGIAMGLTYGLWYKSPFSYVEQIGGITLILVAVDLVMGPLLTLIVYNPAKKSLKFDLAVIGAIQLAALVYGMGVIYMARPIYAVYADGRFMTAAPTEFEDVEVARVKADNPYLRFSQLGTEWVGARIPATATDAEREEISLSAALGGGPRIMPRLYVPWTDVVQEALKSGKRASEIDYTKPPLHRTGVAGRPKVPPTLAELQSLQIAVQKWGLPLEQVVLVPLQGSRRSAIVALDARSGTFLGAIEQDAFWF